MTDQALSAQALDALREVAAKGRVTIEGVMLAGPQWGFVGPYITLLHEGLVRIVSETPPRGSTPPTYELEITDAGRRRLAN